MKKGRVSKGRIKQSNNFVEGKKKNPSCADFLIKKSDVVG